VTRARCRAVGAAGACTLLELARVNYPGHEIPLCDRHLDQWHRWRQDAPATAAALWHWPTAAELDRRARPPAAEQLELE
jgi:hypothetical protein